jgi:hypothetical protein
MIVLLRRRLELARRRPRMTLSSPADAEALLPRPARTPLPKGQLLAVYTIKLMVPVTSFQILPYVNEMVAHAVKRSPNEVGYYSGLVSTAYTVAHLLTVYPWARLSGSWHKPA